MMSAYPTEVDMLLLQGEIVLEFSSGEGMIIAMVLANLDPISIGELFEGMLSFEGFAGPQRDLVVYSDKERRVVDHKGPTIVSQMPFLFTEGVFEVTRDTTDVLVHGHTVAG